MSRSKKGAALCCTFGVWVGWGLVTNKIRYLYGVQCLLYSFVIAFY